MTHLMLVERDRTPEYYPLVLGWYYAIAVSSFHDATDSLPFPLSWYDTLLSVALNCRLCPGFLGAFCPLPTRDTMT